MNKLNLKIPQNEKEKKKKGKTRVLQNYDEVAADRSMMKGEKKDFYMLIKK